MKTKVLRAAGLIKEFIKEYNSQEHPFLLFDLAHVNENDHSRILMSILRYNDCMFLKSFLQYIGAPTPAVPNKITIKPTEQKEAIGNTKDGFIDLYFEYVSVGGCEEKVIIENKIYGAVDTHRQLSRYIATALKMEKEEFDEAVKKWEVGELDEKLIESLKHVHVVYLTLDGVKQPDKKSLPQVFRGSNDEGEYIGYYPISYVKDIIPWLENEVLPNVPYSDDGITIAGVRQYVASLKSLTSSKEDSMVVSSFVNSQGDKGDKEKYDEINAILDIIKPLSAKGKKEDQNHQVILSYLAEQGINIEEDLPLQPLRRNLKAAAEEIFSSDVKGLDNGDWILHFTPSFFILYKKIWATIDTNKLTIPSLYLCGNNFLDNGSITRFGLQVDHIPAEVKDRFYDNICNQNSHAKFSNHDLTVIFDLKEKAKGIVCDDINKLESREKLYKSLIESIKDCIPAIDSVVNEIINEKNQRKLHEKLLESLLNVFI